jgi:integrase
VKGYKRCKCRDETDRELGIKCGNLRRKDGSWNPSHGTWYGKAELPLAPDGKRVALRMGGFATQDEMSEWFDEAMHLLSIPEKGSDGHEVRVRILELVRESRRRKAALPHYDDIRRRYAEGIAFKPGTAGEYLLRWLDKHRANEDWSETTLLSYDRTVRRLFLPAFGDVPLDKLRSKHILDMLGAVDAESERITAARTSEDPEVRASVAGRRPTSQATKRRFLAVIRSALNEAKGDSERLVTANVAEGIKLGKAKKGYQGPKAKLWTAGRESAWREGYEARIAAGGGKTPFQMWRNTAARPGPVMIWKPSHLGHFLDETTEERMHALFCVVAYCGLRRGEACGLRWEDIDFDSGTVMVGTQIVQVGWQALVKTDEAKTEASEEWVRLAEAVTDPLKAWRRRQLEERVRWGPAWADTGFAFTHENGRPYHPAQVTAKFERLAFDAGLAPIRFHDLRHGAATLALAAGKDITAVSAMMRHSSIKITADIYASVLPELAAEVSDAVASMVPRRVAAGGSSETAGLPTVSLAGRKPTHRSGR